MNEDDVYEHLGVPTGYHKTPCAEKVLEKMTTDLTKIDASLLAPWQKIDAVSTFILPCISFHLKNAAVAKKRLTAFDNKIKAAAKRWLNLPQRVGTEILYMSHQTGGMNLMPINTLADASQLVHGLRLLKSPSVGPLSERLLQSVVRRRLRRAATPPEVAEYLNGSMRGDFANESSDISSTWTRLRAATTRLKTTTNVAWATDDNGVLQLTLNDSPLKARDTEKALRCAIRDYYKRRLLAKPDQGKVFHVTSVAMAPNHFMRPGDFTRFADWRFVHRARLDCVLLNGTKRFGNGDKRGRRCGHANETLPHVLNHCLATTWSQSRAATMQSWIAWPTPSGRRPGP